MMENAEGVVRKLVAKVSRRTVSFTRLAGNSLILYIGCEPPAQTGYSLWLEPNWHIGSHQGVLLDSRQAQVEDDNAHAELGALAGQLVGKTIETIEIDPITHDVHVHFDEGYCVNTFVSDPADEDIWDIRDNSKNLAAGATPTRYFVREVQRFVTHENR